MGVSRAYLDSTYPLALIKEESGGARWSTCCTNFEPIHLMFSSHLLFLERFVELFFATSNPTKTSETRW